MAGARLSAGLLLFRRAADGTLEVFLAHPGGPFWARKDAGAWSIPKGEHDPAEQPWDAAAREFAEEIGVAAPPGRRLDLGEVRQPGGKRVTAYAVEADLRIDAVRSNLFEMEWPPRSGALQSFPEVDRAEWFALDEARVKLLKGQAPFLDRLIDQLDQLDQLDNG